MATRNTNVSKSDKAANGKSKAAYSSEPNRPIWAACITLAVPLGEITAKDRELLDTAPQAASHRFAALAAEQFEAVMVALEAAGFAGIRPISGLDLPTVADHATGLSFVKKPAKTCVGTGTNGVIVTFSNSIELPLVSEFQNHFNPPAAPAPAGPARAGKGKATPAPKPEPEVEKEFSTDPADWPTPAEVAKTLKGKTPEELQVLAAEYDVDPKLPKAKLVAAISAVAGFADDDLRAMVKELGLKMPKGDFSRANVIALIANSENAKAAAAQG